MLLLCRSPVTVHRTLYQKEDFPFSFRWLCYIDWPHSLVSNKQVARTTRLQYFIHFRKKDFSYHLFFIFECVCVYVHVHTGIGEGFRFSGASVRLSFMLPDMNTGY